MPVTNKEFLSVKNEGKSYDPIPAGIHHCEIIDVNLKLKEEQKQTGKYPPKDKYIIAMGILNDTKMDNGESTRGRKINHFVTTAFAAGYDGGQQSKLFALFKAVLNDTTLSDQDEREINELIGKRVTIVVEQSTRDGKTYSNITTVTPFAGAGLTALTDEEREAIMPKPKVETDPEMEVNVDEVKAELEDVDAVLDEMLKPDPNMSK
jgi:hypothetical protein